MAFIQKNEVNVGDLLSGTFTELGTIRKELLIYLAAFTALNIANYALSQISAGIGGLTAIAGFICYFVGQYWLYREVLRNAGMVDDPAMRVFSFTAIAFVLVLPIYFGFLFLVIPGIILVSKWIMAPAFLVSGNPSVFGSIGASWNASSNNTLSLSLAFSALFVMWVFPVSILSGLVGGVGTSFLGTAIAGLFFHGLPLLLLGLSVTALKQLTSDRPTLQDVFA